MSDYFLRRAIVAISGDIHPDVLVKLRERAHGMTLQQQLDMLTAEAMVTYREPEMLKGRSPAKPERETVDFKSRAAGDS